MNILILKPGNYKLDFTFYDGTLGYPIIEGTCREKDRRIIREIVRDILSRCREHNNQESPEAIAIYGIYGGDLFKKPELICESTFRNLKKLIPYAPLEIPGILALMEVLKELALEIPQVLLFGSSFFVDLPVRETLYGLDPELMQTQVVRRFGYHGLYHETACKSVLKKMKGGNRGKKPRIISISLNPRPEIAAILGLKPLMVTSGLTPLEGLPGHQTCGEIDPAIVLLLSKKNGWGPEKINDILTRQSGLFALADKTASLDRVLDSGEEKYELAREVLLYRILLACGSAVSVLGGVDVFVFSGQYVRSGLSLVEEILTTKFFNRLAQEKGIGFEFTENSLDLIIAEKAGTTILQRRMETMVVDCV